VLVVTPYYNRPTQAGIEAHFKAAAAATDLPVMVYDVPTRTGRRIAFDVLARLATDVTNIAAFKDATGDPAGAARIAATLPALQIYSGDVALTLSFLAVGAVGVVGTSTHWTGPETGEMIAAFEKGDVVHAREINARLIESYLFENTDECVFSQSIKAMMRTLGLPVGECRLPLGPAPAGTEERAREVYANLRG
jgi:4-hydroxy-tetrahydrodipicolinate synthase